MRIQHNIMAMNAYRNYNTNTKALSGNLEKLSSGYKINRAGDDAAGLAISEKMRAQITGLDAAQKNVKDGISLVKTAEGAMQEIQDMLNRMDYLATQSANGTYDNEVDRLNLQKEVSALKDEINRIADSANFNGIKLLDGSLDAKAAETKVDIMGVNSNKSSGTEAVYSTKTALSNYGATGTEGADGDVFTFNIGFDDGTSKSVQIKLDRSEGDGKNKLTSLDGTTQYGDNLAGNGVVTADELGKAVAAALKATDLNDEFAVKYTETSAKLADGATADPNAGLITLTANEKGTDGRVVRSFDMVVTDTNGNQKPYSTDPTDATTGTILGVTAQQGMDEGREIAASQITEYNGTNLDEALFTINGHKFVVLANELSPHISATDGTTNQEYLRAMDGLGKDVTVLIGGIGGLMDGGAVVSPSTGDDLPLTADSIAAIQSAAAQQKADAQKAMDDAFNLVKDELKTDGSGDKKWADQDAWCAAGEPGESLKATYDAADAADTAAQSLDATKNASGSTYNADDVDVANSNFQQNIKKIAEVTGLTVTGTVGNDGNNINASAGIRLSKGPGNGKKGLTLQIGDTADSYNQLQVKVGDMHTKAMGIADIDIGNQQGAQDAIQTIRNAINYVSGVRGDLGAVQNRLEHTGNNLSVMAENIQDAESTIRDTDVANEMMSYVKNNILVQSAQAMLAQANQVPQGVLQLLG